MNDISFLKFIWSIFLQLSAKFWCLQHIANINNDPDFSSRRAIKHLKHISRQYIPGITEKHQVCKSNFFNITTNNNGLQWV